MKKRIHKLICRTMSIIVLVCFVSGSTVAQTSVWDGTHTAFVNGTGTQSNPYLIESAQHLAYLAYLVNNGLGAGSGNTVGTNTYYKMTIDIDLNGSDTFQWTPIGYYNSNADYYYFGGHFDGDGHTIANLHINSSTIQRGGLFGMLDNGSIRNVGIVGNSSIQLNGSTSYIYAGMIIAYMIGNNMITNCYNIGNISAIASYSHSFYFSYSSYSGGIIGYNGGGLTINNCYNAGIISSSYTSSSSSSPSYPYSSYSSYSGGIIGSNKGSLAINNCYNARTISSSSSSPDYSNYSFSGGIVGHNKGGLTINNSYNTETISSFSSPSPSSGSFPYSYSFSGGIVGGNEGYGKLTINNCYNTGTISSSSSHYYSGGIIGSHMSGTVSITNCYNVGTATHAIIGSSGAIVTNTYYLNTASFNNTYGGDSRTEAFMKSPNFINLLGCAFMLDAVPNTNNGYPIHSGIYLYFETSEVSDIVQNAAKLKAVFFSEGLTILQKGFQYKITNASNYTTVNVSTSGDSLVYILTGLMAGTDYTFKAFVVTAEADTIFGSESSFRTMYDMLPWDGTTITSVTPVGNIYYIYIPSELAWIAQQCNAGDDFYGKTIMLMNDIDLGGALATPSTWVPIGTSTNFFRGNFDGNHYVINNLYNNSVGADNIGLFGCVHIGYVSNGAMIKNVILHNAQITGKNNVGGIVGSIYDDSYNIANCYVTGRITGNTNIGGIIGNGYYNYYSVQTTINNSFFNGYIEGNSNIGGIIGYAYSTTINNCYAGGSIYGTSTIGGIIGYSTYFRINNCYSTLTLRGESNIGGIIGSRSTGTTFFTNCYFDKQMAGIEQGVGDGEQTGTSGKTSAEMTTTTSFGMSNNLDANYPSTWVYTNGLYPQLDIFANHSNVDIQKASQLSVAPVFLQNNETSEGVSTDFTLSTANGVTWNSSLPQAIGINGGSASVNPLIIDSEVILTASLNGLEKKICLNVIGADTIHIFTADELLLVANQCNNGSTYEGKYIKLMNDITLPLNEANNMVSIGDYENNRPFMGTFNGNGKLITNVYIDKPNNPYQGFFGYTKDAYLYEVGLVNITASGRNYTGGMVAYAENTYIKDCYVNGGTLFALTYVGGLVGYQSPGTNSIISGCYNTCEVSATKYVGGLVGYSDNATVRNSYVASKVTGNDIFTTGAIIGGAEDVLMYNCYFSTQITGQSAAIGEDNTKSNEGLTNAQMQTQEFVNTLNQGLTRAVWKMDYSAPINNNFPILIWQRGNGNCEPPINLRVVEVKGTDVSLSWQGSTNGYFLVEYTKTGGTPQTRTVSTTSITLTALDEHSEYSWQVKNVCNEEESNYVQGANFTTSKGSTGIGNYTENKNGIFIYPNPTQNTLHIQSSSTIEQVSIYDISGRMLKQIANPSPEINVCDLANGIYLIKVKTTEGETTRKMIKN